MNRSKAGRVLPACLLTSRVLFAATAAYLLVSAICLIVLHEEAHSTLKQSSVVHLGTQKRAFGKQSPPITPHRMWKYDREVAEARLASQGASSIRRTITAYIEGPYPPPDAVVSPGDRGDMNVDKDPGTPPTFKTPLPLRTQGPNDLQRVTYPRVQTCQDLPHGLPVDRGLQFDDEGNPLVWNVGDDPEPPDFPQMELPYCPVEADPFLPWIHDIFPSLDGTEIHVLAQNKRRCRTGKKFDGAINRLLPQVALMQPVSVQRVTQSQAHAMAPDLWHKDDGGPRYRLVPLDEADVDGRYTRFICRFHSLDFATGRPVVLNETLSTYPFNYELAAFRKGNLMLHTPKGKDGKFFWTSNLHFTCPVPKSLQALVATGTTVLSDGTPTLWLDIVPFRTPARYRKLHLGPELIGPLEDLDLVSPWNVTKEMGHAHIEPAVAASGRWANLPICAPYAPRDTAKKVARSGQPWSKKPHYLSACLWASAEFKTRGQKKGALSDTSQRLREWLTFHFMVGFDHVYVYDNSAANSNTSNLEPILREFGDRVTRIEWPSVVCNNNIPAADSTGERSSQYAAENSCRSRYAPFTEWISSFDTDEFFVPMGKYTSLTSFLKDADKADTNILSFRSSRGRLRQESSIHVGNGRERLPNTTFLEAYNCDSAGSPKPAWADRARKQIYRSDYVEYHFVHYSTVTKGHMQTYDHGYKRTRFAEKPPSERVVDEINEAVLVHTKTIKKDMTTNYEKRCRADYPKKWQGYAEQKLYARYCMPLICPHPVVSPSSCWVAYPWPQDREEPPNQDVKGMEYNCFINRNVERYWAPKLREALSSHLA